MARRIVLALTLLTTLIVSACNLVGAPSQEEIAQTSTAETTTTAQPSWTPISTNGAPTTLPLTQQTSLPTFAFPTAVISFPTSVPPVVFPTAVPFFPTNTPLPVSIVILSPVPGNIVAGNVQILGSASHPEFLQYQVEFGPDPNPGNLWFPATSAVTNPVLNGLLGVWNTTTVQDARYQLRLRVYLRDGTLLTTVLNNITVQNRVNTPVPSPTINIPRPIAAFSQDKASGDVPLTVHFVNQSTGTINTVSWNFGDGNASNDVSPSHTFGAPGLYTVTLTVTGPGGSSNVSRQINATSPTAPIAGFTQDKSSGLTPLTVQFSDQSSGNITSYLWNFSDGSTSSQRNPAHTFTTPGTYNVFLTVSGPGGSSSVTRQITVTSLVSPTFTPSLTFTPTFTPSNTTTPVPPTATFTPSATPTDTATSVPPTQTETQIAVVPTDTPTNIPPTLTNTPSDTPTFTTTPVPPTATFTPSDTPTFTTTPVPPTATFTPSDTPTNTSTPVPPTPTPTNTNTPFPTPQAGFSAAANPANPLAIQFTSQTTGQIASYAWDFGDGSQSTDQNPQHTYAQAGNYTVTLTVTDTQGQTATFSGALTVSAPLQASFTAQPNGLTVTFTDTSTGPVASRSWNFGDGSAPDTNSPTQHTYAQGGTYTVTLTVTDASGQSNSTQQQVTVTAPLQASFTAQPNGLTVTFTDTSTGAVASRSWNFGDGSAPDTNSPTQHTYAQGGTYTVTLTVTDAGGQSTNSQQQVTVTAPLQASFTAQPNGLTVTFTDTSTGAVASRSWNFGDGSAPDTNSPTQHTYAQGGTYTVTLTVTDASGQSTNSQQQVTVAAPLQASFTAQPTDLTVTFTDTSTGQIASRSWDFGDGSPADTNSPTQHTYAQGGTYTVTLTVTDAGGQSTNSQQQITVTAPATTQAPPTQPQQTIVDTTPVLPDLKAQRDYLRGIYMNGSATNSPHVFGFAGDSVFTENGILSPFATNGQYNLNNHNDLKTGIDWYSSVDLGGNNSFNHPSVAVNGNWTAQDLLDPSKADPSCNGDSPLACELHQIHPVLLFVAIGSNDAKNGTDVNAFSNALTQIVVTITSNNTIPVLMTLPDDGSIPNIEAINEAIIAVAQQNNVPLLNGTRALRELQGGTNMNTSPNGPGALGNGAVSKFGVNALNLDLLQTLTDARKIIFPDAS